MHVHDLVDYVSEEAVIAGRAAVEYLRGKNEKNIDVNIVTDGKIRYTVPRKITKIEDTKVYFRVSDVYRDKKICVRSSDKLFLSKKKQKLAPGEMETVTLTAEMLSQIGGEISFSIED